MNADKNLDLARVRDAFPERRIVYYETIDSTMTAAAGLDGRIGGDCRGADRRAGPARPLVAL